MLETVKTRVKWGAGGVLVGFGLAPVIKTWALLLVLMVIFASSAWAVMKIKGKPKK